LTRPLNNPIVGFATGDDSFLTWPHGPHKLNAFLNQLNGIHQCIQFTMETEWEGHLPFLGTQIVTGGPPGGSVGHREYLNRPIPISTLTLGPIRTHPTNKLCSSHWRTRLGLSECGVGLPEGLRTVGYRDRQISRALNRRPDISKPNDEPSSVSLMPSVGPIFSRMMSPVQSP
jgi:hypothetical protein